MRHLLPFALIATLLVAAPAAQARDSRLHLDVAAAIAAGQADGTLDGSVRFHFKGAPALAVVTRHGPATTNRKTNALNKSDEEACRWVLLSALVALQEAAKDRGANAVVDIVSDYKGREFASATQYECGAGTLMAGVALKGVYATVR